MNWNWLSLENLLNLNTLPGIAALALILILVAVLVSFLLTRIILRSQLVMGRFGRRIDETVLRYAIRLKTLFIFLTALLVFSNRCLEPC